MRLTLTRMSSCCPPRAAGLVLLLWALAPATAAAQFKAYTPPPTFSPPPIYTPPPVYTPPPAFDPPVYTPPVYTPPAYDTAPKFNPPSYSPPALPTYSTPPSHYSPPPAYTPPTSTGGSYSSTSNHSYSSPTSSVPVNVVPQKETKDAPSPTTAHPIHGGNPPPPPEKSGDDGGGGDDDDDDDDDENWPATLLSQLDTQPPWVKVGVGCLIAVVGLAVCSVVSDAAARRKRTRTTW